MFVSPSTTLITMLVFIRSTNQASTLEVFCCLYSTKAAAISIPFSLVSENAGLATGKASDNLSLVLNSQGEPFLGKLEE